MHDITRYEVNEHGELPLTHGRYCRWEDVEDLLIQLYKKIDNLEDEVDNGSATYQEGYDDGYADAREEFEDEWLGQYKNQF